MDDGTRSGTGIKIATHCFDKKQWNEIILILWDLYGLKATVVLDGNEKYVIYIWSES
jgi:hypothetical protein